MTTETMAPAAPAMFWRDGTPYTGAVRTRNGKLGFFEPYSCIRCGGAGGHEKWRHTGWTCYDCGGHRGPVGHRWVNLYTAEQIEKLDARKAATAARKAEKHAADVAARQAEFRATHGETLDAARKFAAHSEPLASIIATAERECLLTDRMASAIARLVDVARERRERNARMAAERVASQHVGTVGQAIEIDAEARFVRAFDGRFGTTYIVGLRDAAGNSIIYKGSTTLGLGAICGEDANYNLDVRGCRVRLTATVKEHGVRDGERQTIIARPRNVSASKAE